MSRRKTVAFADNDELMYHEGAPGTPSPTMSGSTMSSPEIESPLQLDPPALPHPSYCHFGLPSTMSSPPVMAGAALKLNKDLALRSNNPQAAVLFNYDMRRNPELDPFTPSGVVTPSKLACSAVEPQASKMRVLIKIPGSHQPVLFEVRPTSGKSYVTVLDVLKGIYGALKQPVNTSPEQLAPDAGNAFGNRSSLLRKKEKIEVSPALVDLLGSRFQFGGLQYNPKGEEWHLESEEGF